MGAKTKEIAMSKIRKWIAVGGSILLTLTSLVGLPLKYYSQHVNDLCYNEERLPKIWTPYAAKMYALSYMKMWYPDWGRGEHKALMKLWGKESAW